MGWFLSSPAGKGQHTGPYRLDTGNAGPVISPLLFGHNLEVTRRAVWSGLGAEMVANRKFAAIAGGSPKRWTATGSGVTLRSDSIDAFAGKYSARVETGTRGGGILQQQEMLSLRQGGSYTFRIITSSDKPLSLYLRISNGIRQPLAELVHEQAAGGWQLWSGNFTAKADIGATLEIGSPAAASFRIGAVSLQQADHFLGMRRDVINRMKEIRPGTLRFPGGCYAEFYNWRDGLLPVDRRPPIGPTGLDFLLRNSDDVDNQELGIDEFVALCRKVGAEPAITLRMSERSPADAAALVAYCNGGPETEWGRIRAARGYPEPYRIKTWFLGNELYFFGRGGMNDPLRCAEQTKLFAEAVRKVDPAAELVGCTNLVNGGNNTAWNNPLLGQSAGLLSYASCHDYMRDAFQPKVLRDYARAATDYLRPAFQRFQKELAMPLVFDEWNTMWGEPGSAAMGLYVAGVLNLLCREGAELGVRQSFYFQPVTEGAIRVSPNATEPDEAGKVFAAFGAHQGNRLIRTPLPEAGEAIDLCASLSPDGQSMVITIVNRDSVERVAELEPVDFKPAAGSYADLLEPAGTELTGGFLPMRRVPVTEDVNRLKIAVPALSVACVRLIRKN
jgi:alpha-N-arabinofuranosidase